MIQNTLVMICMYNNQINNSINKMKATWNIRKAETNRVKGTTNTVHNNSPEAFNRYFLSISQNIISDIRSNTNQSISIAKKTKLLFVKTISCTLS